MSREVAIRGANLSFRFPDGFEVLSEIDFQVELGEAVALFGSNGAGKSTLLNLCLGYLYPTSGTIEVLGEDPAGSPNPRRACVAYVPETVRLYPTMSGEQLITFFGDLDGQRASRRHRDEALEQVGFPLAALGRPTATYSKGMRQKIVLALGLLKAARVFLLDEPTSGLDPQTRQDLAEAIRDLATAGVGVLFTTHDDGLARAAASRALHLAGGKLRRDPEVG